MIQEIHQNYNPTNDNNFTVLIGKSIQTNVHNANNITLFK